MQAPVQHHLLLLWIHINRALIAVNFISETVTYICNCVYCQCVNSVNCENMQNIPMSKCISKYISKWQITVSISSSISLAFHKLWQQVLEPDTGKFWQHFTLKEVFISLYRNNNQICWWKKTTKSHLSIPVIFKWPWIW